MIESELYSAVLLNWNLNILTSYKKIIEAQILVRISPNSTENLSKNIKLVCKNFY